MEWFKKLIGEALYEKLSKEQPELLKQLGNKVGTKKVLIEEKEGDWIPKARFDEVNQKKTSMETELTQAKASIEKLQGEYNTLKEQKDNGSKTVEDQIKSLTEKITSLQTALDTKSQESTIQSKRAVVEKQFMQLKANEAYLPTLMREFELKHPLDKLEIVDGKIKDAENIFKPFQETFKPLFGEVAKQGYDHKAGTDPGAGDYFTIDQIRGMSQAEVNQNLDKVNKSLEFHSSQGN